MVLPLSNFELDRDQRAPDQDHGVDSRPESRHIELEEDPSFQAGEGSPEDLDFTLPGVSLIEFDRECTLASDGSQHCIVRLPQEGANRCCVPGGCAGESERKGGRHQLGRIKLHCRQGCNCAIELTIELAASHGANDVSPLSAPDTPPSPSSPRTPPPARAPASSARRARSTAA